jgi:hypothetical protein
MKKSIIFRVGAICAIIGFCGMYDIKYGIVFYLLGELASIICEEFEK